MVFDNGAQRDAERRGVAGGLAEIVGWFSSVRWGARHQARASSLRFLEELEVARAPIAEALATAGWEPLRRSVPLLPSWERTKPELAGVLARRQWSDVVAAAEAVDRVRALVDAGRIGALEELDRQALRDAVATVDAALTSLPAQRIFRDDDGFARWRLDPTDRRDQ
ncbi:hypothetical protein SK069_00785 [Patulibacter brassicae]|uniref:Uncharacterized protein n=1 Tax=Patulibacter brassicae TaxID=1705717 RepID=A0ABU4VEA9_9ACTN|nr:hypothetical protein [Patulibacter brassicae]MDX8150114.1 hypothetical protein [Patulibacter brassicae]